MNRAALAAAWTAAEMSPAVTYLDMTRAP